MVLGFWDMQRLFVNDRQKLEEQQLLSELLYNDNYFCLFLFYFI